MDMRKVILLIVLIGAEHVTASSRLKQIFQMLTDLQDHVIRLEEEQTQINENLRSLEENLTGVHTSLMKQLHGDPPNCIPNVQTLPEASTTPEASTPIPTQATARPRDCAEIFDRSNPQDGVYTIYPDGNPVAVFCRSGSIVLTKRFDGSLDFNRTMKEYSAGFGDLQGEHWLGLSHIYRITRQGRWRLRFDLESFDNDTSWATFDDFFIGPEKGFELNYDKSSYQGTAGNYRGLGRNHGQKFTTRDYDQDNRRGNCASNDGYWSGGWWYDGHAWCTYVATTLGGTYADRSIMWYDWKEWDALKSAIMQIKRID